MKKILTLTALAFSLAVSAEASLLFSNNAITGLLAGDDGKVGSYIVSKDGSALPTSLSVGLSLTDSATYGASFEFISTNNVADFFGYNLASGGTVNYGDGVDAGDLFGIILFDASTATTLAGDTYRIYTDASWVLPADPSGALSFGSDFAAVSAPTGSGSVVPEASTYAALSGLLALGYVMVRRRRA
jgi:hypothetical protein